MLSSNCFVIIMYLWLSINQSIKTHLYSAICRKRMRGAWLWRINGLSLPVSVSFFSLSLSLSLSEDRRDEVFIGSFVATSKVGLPRFIVG